jgi:hypothetical protein
MAIVAIVDRSIRAIARHDTTTFVDGLFQIGEEGVPSRRESDAPCAGTRRRIRT